MLWGVFLALLPDSREDGLTVPPPVCGHCRALCAKLVPGTRVMAAAKIRDFWYSKGLNGMLMKSTSQAA